ncbi:hemerythrin domain-containing protein [Ramlibacter rhizophilus]|uniref:Hemerythrin domain-containing protein n=1 Tax=Ramlibacter rhizophilus TaxID=1781167 RepID=A0A4Z0BIM1_9BURK|nr:hemerythrin domain-containing protein [Ramlibacter rhizophilus]TFY97984.1 hemerythrin domain-containing protein [Ramlibacter rhizophilus]
MPTAPSAFQIIRDEHAAVAAVLRSMLRLVEQGPEDQPMRFFDVLRAMLFYIDEFPEQRHHPKESDLLFPRIARIAPELMPVIRRLEADHVQGESRVRELQHLLLAWELLGESRREAFVAAAREYVRFYLDHMRVEEVQLLPLAERELSPEDRSALDAAFRQHRDPLSTGQQEPGYERLFTRIVLKTPAPLGVG